MKIALITDAWVPQVNGVVTTLNSVVDILKKQGHDILVINPNMFFNMPCPSYPEIRLSKNPWRIKKFMKDFDPDAIHIATEGPLGLFGRWWCLRNKKSFTTSYHTKFPEYIKVRYMVPLWLTYWWLRRFHNKSNGVLITTESMKRELEYHGFKNLTVWTRGVDQKLFNPNKRKTISRQQTNYLYVGRISIEKNITAFLDLKIAGKKIVVGDGPQLKKLKEKYKDVEFIGVKLGKELSEYYANADVFVFPSKSDTFGVVLIEALASGTPVAAYPVTGPIDVIKSGRNGFLDENLGLAVSNCIHLANRTLCRESVKDYTWENCAQIFLDHLVLVSR